MLDSLKTGFSFGLTSGTITTLGLMVGLHAGTHSRLAVLGGILTIAIADAFSDALGIHISEEAEGKHTPLEIWASTIFTFLTKFIIAVSFLIPLLVFPLNNAVIVSIIYGLSLIAFFSFYLAKQEKSNPLPVVFEHLLIAVIVISLTHVLGDWIRTIFV
jgi:VIT1/CCC1 family predicted Fe2+/Mn2+ transporter